MTRGRFAGHGLVQRFFDRVNRWAILEAAADREEFAVDGTRAASYASLKPSHPADRCAGPEGPRRRRRGESGPDDGQRARAEASPRHAP